VTNTLKLHRHGAVGFIDWLDGLVSIRLMISTVANAASIRHGYDNNEYNDHGQANGKAPFGAPIIGLTQHVYES
jgi:hypothetical protein